MSNVLKISEAASLALHTMVLLAVDPEKFLSAREMASTIHVSGAHLSKVLQRLVRVGLVRSNRGPKGGFLLEKSPHKISLLEVYEAIEGELAPSNCLLGNPVCSGKKCILDGLLQKMNNQVKEYLAGTKLVDLTNVYWEGQCLHSEK